MNEFSILLQEIIDAGQDNKLKLELDMSVWQCGTSCCACGDVAVARLEGKGDENIFSNLALLVADELEIACKKIFKNVYLAKSVYSGSSNSRRQHASVSGSMNEDELEHIHLNKNHNNRKILHDYIRLIIAKSESTKCVKEI